MKFSIIIPSYTNHQGLYACLDSIIEHTDLSETEILVVGNGSAPEVQDVHLRYPCRLIWFPEAIGYTRACNEGMKAAKGSHFILLNDDVIIQGRDWIPMLYQPFVEDPLMAITGPLMLTAPETQRDFLVFFCVMISREVTESIGLLDEIFNPGYAEDCDYAHRAEDHGWKIQQVPPTQAKLIDKGCEDLPEWKRNKMWSNFFPCFHDGNQTFGKQPKFDGLIKRNSAILAERYGPKVKVELNTWRAKTIDGWFGEDEIDWLAGQVTALPKGARVCEIGSWHGRSSRAIADNLPEGAQAWCVDTFIGSSGEPEMHGSAHYDRGDHAHQWWWCNLQEHINAGKVVPVRMHSDNAAHTFSYLIGVGLMEKFDLIFIDGDHSEEGIKLDVESWLPLLKEGGLMCGHDYYKENEGPYWVHVREYVEQRFPNVEKSATSIWHVRPNQPPPVAEYIDVLNSVPVWLSAERGHVYDCFIFCAELDLLELRLSTLNEVVDRFVLVEGTKYHNGDSKELFFDQNKERFAKWLPKITHIVVDDWPTMSGNVYDCAWARERHQRDSILHGLKDCKDNDIIILGDADEIPNPDAVAKHKVSDGLVRLKQRMFYYFLNCENKEGWDWQKIAPYSLVKERTPCGIRYPDAGNTPLVENGGWHWSFLGNTDGVIKKMQTYSHQEFNTPEMTDKARVESLIERGEDIFGRDLRYEFVDIDDNYPAYVKAHEDELYRKGLIKLRAENVEATKVEWVNSRHWSVTAMVSTKDRYQTTLPLALSAIINQTHLPDKLKIYDDGEQKNLFELAPFNGLLRLAQDKGIDVEVLSTPRQGQVSNHQHCLDNATTDLIWRVDDDEIPEPNCLDTLLNTIRDYERGGSADKVGAVGGLVHHPGNVSPLPETLTGALIDIDRGNILWHQWNSGPREVEHLYSSFIYRTGVGREVGGYPRDLSPVGHREESWLSSKIQRAGYKLLVTPHTTTWHLRESTGGIRSFSDTALWEHDEQKWQGYLRAINLVPQDSKIVCLDLGLGDHLIFLGIFPELRRRFPDRKWTIAVCHPEIFNNYPDVTLISIADAKLLLGHRYDSHSVYKHAWDNNFVKPMAEIMMEFYSQ